MTARAPSRTEPRRRGLAGGHIGGGRGKPRRARAFSAAHTLPLA